MGENDWDRTVDVLVAGSGGAGLSAAVIAADRGASVHVVEKASRIGGTTRKSAGFMWVPNNHFLQAAGIVDGRDGALRYMARLSRPLKYDPTHITLGLPAWEYEGIAAHYDNAAAAIVALTSVGAIDVSHAAGFPDFYGHLPEDETPVGRTLFPTAGGGGPTGGAILVDELARAAERLGVTIQVDAPVVELITDADGAVLGVGLGGSAAGERIRATRGVLFATGGFAQNVELRDRYLDRSFSGTCSASGNVGDFLAIAREAGGQFAALDLSMRAPILIERLAREGDDFRATFIIPGDATIVVNRFGKRVVSEKASYHDIGRAFFEWDARSASYPNTPLIAIWDAQVAASYGADALGNPVPVPDADDYWVITGTDLADLRASIAARLATLGPAVGHAMLDETFAAGLDETIERFARFSESGVDEDFGRGGTPAQVALGGYFGVLGDGPNPMMRALSDEGPYYAAILTPGIFETVGGPVVDVHGRVLDRTSAPIPNLYGVGGAAACPWGEAAWSGGHNVAYALTSGYRVATAVVGDASTAADLARNDRVRTA